jgi:lipoate-protein ligase A
MPAVRLLPFETLPGPAQMAADEAMLHTAAERGVASLRFYAWSEPTVSLGYFQPAADRAGFPLPWVRRATGGAALVHHHELTYALALPPGRDWHDPGRNWTCRMHHTIRDALAPRGVRLRAVVCGEEKKLGPVLCFLHQTPGDLLCDGAKVVGSAQRKQKGAVLQHGGILLRRSEFAPALAGVAELSGVDLSADEVMRAVAGRFAADTGWPLEPGEWTADDLARRAEVGRDKYAAAAWNDKR